MTHLDDGTNLSTTISPIALFIAARYGLDVPFTELSSVYVSAMELATRREDLSDVVLRVLAEERAVMMSQRAETAGRSMFALFTERLPMEPLSIVDEAQFEIIKSASLTTFRQAASTPEQRLLLAKQYDFPYETLTNWVIRADLMRIDNVDTEAADLLASAGIMGVHDLALYKSASRAKTKERTNDLATRMEEKLQSIFTAGLDPSLRQILHSSAQSFIKKAHRVAKEQPPQIVTATEVVVFAADMGTDHSNIKRNSFLKNLWSAVKSIDKEASLSQPSEILLDHTHSDATSSSDEAQLTEIRSGERRIWIKQVTWPKKKASLTQAMNLEWRMSTYRFGRLIHDLIWPRHDPESPPDLQQIRSTIYLQYLSIFTFLFFTFWTFIWSWSKTTVEGVLALTQVSSLQTSTVTAGITILLGMGVMALLALLPGRGQAQKIYQRLNDHHKDASNKLKPLPGLPKWLLFLLMASVVINPIRYSIGLLSILLVVQAILLARDTAWAYRQKAHSDSDLSEHDVYVDENGKEHIYRKEEGWQTRLFLSPLVYRYFAMLGIPMMRIVYLMTYPLHKIPPTVPLLGQIGPAIYGAMSGLFGCGVSTSGICDPVEHKEMRDAIESDIRFFDQRPDVNHIHVCAHSDSSLITFETLFHYLPASFRSKIKSFLSFSSPLSYHQQVKPVLTEQERHGQAINRFPIMPYPGFAKGFRWLNFWNSYDPQTEFYALDEYELQQMKPRSAEEHEPYGPRHRAERSAISPTNIKTKGHWLMPIAHNAYWHNMQEVQEPLAHRLMGHTECEEWAHNKPTEWNSKRQHASEPHATYLFKVALGTATLHLAFVCFWWMLAQVLNQYVYTLPNYQSNVNSLATWLETLPFGEGLSLALAQVTATYQADAIWLALLIGFFLLVSRLRPYYGKSGREQRRSFW